MNLWQEYKQPASLAEAIEDLNNAHPPAMLIAGGTDLLLDIKQGRHQPAHTMIDLTAVYEMVVIELRGEDLFIGAAVPINRITQHPMVIDHAMSLVEACNLIAGPQVRNTATLGGNVAHALPAAEGTIALTALDAQAEVADASGLRRLRLNELFLGPGKSAINKSAEIITGFYLPLAKAGQASCFKRIMRPQGVALPILNYSVWLDRDQETIADIHIAVGPGSITPFRATEAEAVLREQIFNEGSFTYALRSILEQAKFRSSPRRASEDYRKHILAGLFKDTLETAWERAGN
jgi:carbon-monoxide dehydrogenase medium subunit